MTFTLKAITSGFWEFVSLVKSLESQAMSRGSSPFLITAFLVQAAQRKIFGPSKEDLAASGMSKLRTAVIVIRAAQKFKALERARNQKILKEKVLPDGEEPTPKWWGKYQALLAENQREKQRDFIVPKRRVCGFGGMEPLHRIDWARRAIFITDEEILKIHPMRFLRSPFLSSNLMEHPYSEIYENDVFVESLFDTLINTQLHAIALTESGRHVLLQQAVKSCVPACVAMLVLDHGKTPNYRAIEVTNLASRKQAVRWVIEAGFIPKITAFPDKRSKTEVLIQCLKKNGPGVLAIDHPEISGHVIVLDEISKEAHTAIIRDSFHGWALTIKLDALLSWIDRYSYFLQIVSFTSSL